MTGLHSLTHQFDLRRGHGKADEVPREGLESLERHGQGVVHSPARYCPACHNQVPRPPVVSPGARLMAGRRQVLIERRSDSEGEVVGARDEHERSAVSGPRSRGGGGRRGNAITVPSKA